MSVISSSRPDRGALAPGAPIEVRTRYLANWSPGFEIVAVLDDAVQVRRLSDGVTLPVTVRVADVRPARTS